MSQELSVNLVGLPEPIHVTFVHGIDEMQIQRPGNPVVKAIQLKQNQAARFSNALAAMYLDRGQGTYDTEDVRKDSGLHPNSFQPSLAILDRLAPDDVAEVIAPSEDYPRQRIYFGNLAIASSKPTPEKREQFAERRNPEEIGDKLELLAYNHAIVMLPPSGEECYMPLDSPLAVLGLRVLQALSVYPDDRIKRHIGAQQMAMDIWAQMPATERQLFTNDEARLAGKGQFMEKTVMKILRGLAEPLGLVYVGSARTQLLQNRIDTQLVVTPPSDEFLGQNPRTISVSEIEFSEAKRAPDLDQTAVERLKLDAAKILAYGSEEMFGGDNRHRRGLDILDVLMPREGKQALREVMGGDEVSDEALQEVIDKLERAAERLLGTNSFLLAKRERTIAGGWHAVGKSKVQLRGGTLNAARTKWTVGLYSDSRALREQPSSVEPKIRPDDNN